MHIDVRRLHRPRVLASLLSLVMVMSLAAAVPGRVHSDLSPAALYVYDELGRLRGVTVPDGQTAVLRYDAVGNLVAVERHPSDALSLVATVPAVATPGGEVTLHGTGFAPAPAGNRVRIGDRPAQVLAATPYAVTVRVPDDAATGPVTVTTGRGTVRSEQPLVVAAPPVVTDLFPPVVRPGDRLTVTGTGFTGDPTLDQVVVADGWYATVESTTPTAVTVTVPPQAVSGEVSVATPDGTGHSATPLVVLPWPDRPAGEVATVARAAPGEAVPVEVAPGRAAVLLFDGAAGHRVTVEVDGDLACDRLLVGLAGPGGVVQEPVGPGGFRTRWCGEGPDRALRLPADGTYTLLVEARDDRGGTGTLTLTALPPAETPPATAGPTAPPSPSDPVTPSTPGPSPSAGPSTPASKGRTADPSTELARIADSLVVGSEPLPDGSPVAPVDLSSGALLVAHTDLVVDDILPLPLTRAYQPVTRRPPLNRDVREFGLGSGLEYALRLELSTSLQFADLVLSDGSTVPFERVTPGVDEQTALLVALPTGGVFDGARITSGGERVWLVQLATGTVLEFHGRRQAGLAALRDPGGAALTVTRERDRLGRLGPVTAVRSPSGRWIAFTYDDRGRITEATDHLGRWVRYRYHPEGMLAEAVGSTGERIGYAYDDRRRIVEITGPDGEVVLSVDYDADGRVSRQVLDDGTEYRFTYRVEQVTVEVEGPGGESVATTAEAVVATEVVDPTGAVRRVRFDTDGRWIEDTWAAGTPEGQTVRAERDAATGLITALVDPAGERVGARYDARGTLTALQSAGGEVTVTRNPDTGEVTTAVTSGGARYEFRYDARGNLLESVDPGGARITYAYDAMGRPVSVTGPDGRTTTISYELAHRVTVTDPFGHTYREYYDAYGRLAAVTDAVGATTRIRYDDHDRPVAVIDPAGGETRFGYDDRGNLVSLTDAAGNTTTWRMDHRGAPVQRTDPTGATDSYVYDTAGRLVAHVDRRGLRTTYDYDALGRLVSVSYGVADDGTVESQVTLRYDTAGRLVGIDDTAYGTVELVYDDAGRLVREVTPDGEIAYEYDASDRRTAMVLPDGTRVRYGYDEAGRLVSVETDGAAVVAERDPSGELRRLGLPHGVTAEYRTDARGLVTGIDYRDAHGALIGDLAYTYRPDGRRATVAGSLAQVELPEPTGPRRFDAANRLVHAGAAQLVYDAAGNLVHDGVNTYTWDARGRLVAVDGPVSARFTYDPFDRRRSIAVDGRTTRYVYDVDNVVQRHRPDGEVVTHLYGLGPDDLLARVGPDGAGAYLTDVQGSVLGLVGAPGRVDVSYRYEPYGATVRTGPADVDDPFAFTGRELDPTGLYHYRNRYYHPQLGRFLSEDPTGFEAGDPNLYAYVFGDPVNLVDPTGQQAVAVGGLAVCFAALGAGLAVATDAFAEMVELLDPRTGPGFGDPATAIALDRLQRRTQLNVEVTLTICHVALGLGVPNFGGLVTRGVTGFGRGGAGVIHGLPSFGRQGLVGRPGWWGGVPGFRPGPPMVRPGPAGPVRLPAGRPLGRPFRVGCSFHPDTPVLLADGSTAPISRVAVGDRVLAADPATGEYGPREVTAVSAHRDTLVDLRLGDTVVSTTADHPFWSDTASAWLAADQLTTDDRVRTADGDSLPVGGLVEGSTRVGLAYDLTVADLASYHVLVGDEAVLVHNCDTVPPRFIVDRAGTVIDRASVNTGISVQRQYRHLHGHPLYNNGGYFHSLDEAQQVLDAFHSGAAEVLGVTKGGHIRVRYTGVTGYNNNPVKGYLHQPTHVFMIKGSTKPSVVPTSPEVR